MFCFFFSVESFSSAGLFGAHLALVSKAPRSGGCFNINNPIVAPLFVDCFFCPRKRLYRPPLINGDCVSDLVILSSFVSFNFDANACYALRYDNLGISTLPLFVWYRKQSFLQMNGNDLNVYIHEVISIACSFVFLLLLEEFLSLN